MEEAAAAKGKTAGHGAMEPWSQSNALGPWQKETPKVGIDWQGKCGQLNRQQGLVMVHAGCMWQGQPSASI